MRSTGLRWTFRPIADVEDGVPRAVAGVFGRDVQSKACFYHITQNTWRKVQQLALINHYRDNEDFRMLCGKMDGLAFLPADEVPPKVWLA